MNNQNLFRRISVALLFVLWLAPLSLFGQVINSPQTTSAVRQMASAKVETVQFESKLVGKTLPYRVVLPPDYAAKEAANVRYPVLYLLHGLTGHFDNWTDKTKLAQYAMNYRVIIVTPEGNNGWYVDSATVPQEKYESYIIQELMPDVEKRYRTMTSREGRAIAGLSMGGYGALKFGLKYPEKFVFAGSLSGALKAAAWSDMELTVAGNWVKAPITQAFGTGATETRKQNEVYQMVKDLTPEKTAALPFIYLSCGTEDFLIADNQQMMQTLLLKKVPHEFRQTPGIHDWKFWDAQVLEILRVSDKFLAKAQ